MTKTEEINKRFSEYLRLKDKYENFISNINNLISKEEKDQTGLRGRFKFEKEKLFVRSDFMVRTPAKSVDFLENIVFEKPTKTILNSGFLNSNGYEYIAEIDLNKIKEYSIIKKRVKGTSINERWLTAEECLSERKVSMENCHYPSLVRGVRDPCNPCPYNTKREFSEEYVLDYFSLIKKEEIKKFNLSSHKKSVEITALMNFERDIFKTLKNFGMKTDISNYKMEPDNVFKISYSGNLELQCFLRSYQTMPNPLNFEIVFKLPIKKINKFF